MITFFIIATGLVILIVLLLLGHRKGKKRTEELASINRATIHELELCTGKKWRDAYKNWEKVRSLRVRFFLLLHL